MSPTRTVLVLAAGMGTRMKSAVPKVLHPVLGRTLLGHVLHAAKAAHAQRTIVVVGQAADQVTTFLEKNEPDAIPVLQKEQRGTGHAVRTALDGVPDTEGTVLVLCGDTPLLRGETVAAFIDDHDRSGRAGSVLTAHVNDPTGLGRIIRDDNGDFKAIVEHRDATAQQLAITEINSGICAFDAALLREMLSKLTSDNDQGEEYLTDVLGLLREAGHRVGVHAATDVTDTLGCNDRAQLADLRSILRDRVNTQLLKSGVTLDDPATTWIDVTAQVEPDVTIRPGVQLLGDTYVSAGAVIGPDSTIENTTIGKDAHVIRAHCIDATIGEGCSVGPFAYLRPGAVLEETSKVGTYVEVKNSTLAKGAKVPHLTYVGDADIGSASNIGAGTIFANYDGVNKHPTKIGEAVFVGSNSVLVAPVEIDDGAYVAAGSSVASDVPAGALAVARGRQHNSEGWVERRRPGTKSAAAAERAATK